uniref:Cathepsin L n=1 Tax=Aceria tosichella TaxID=561515 RepID=A0A6G1SKE1_9ACAR
MRISFIVLVCAASVSQLVLARQSSLGEWSVYKRRYGKVYETPEEDAQRFSLFLASKEKIERRNQNTTSSYKLDVNHFSDWTQEELSKLTGSTYDYSSIKSSEKDEYLRKLMDEATVSVPDELDWRKVPNRVSSVKDQMKCASSWAFAAIGALEGQQVVRNFTKKLIPLSAQDLVDCSDMNQHCFGGTAHQAFRDVARMSGINSDDDYPYEGKESDDGCAYRITDSVMVDKGYSAFDKGEDELKKLVAQFGPVAVGVSPGIGLESWLFYKSGVYDNAKCGEDIEHEALVVGYGSDHELGDYWIIKNSWSQHWGEEGYIRLRRGKGTCAIGKYATIPTFDK